MLERNCDGGPAGEVCQALDGERAACQSLCALSELHPSSSGCEFWAVNLDNAFVQVAETVYDAAGAQYAVIVANPGDAVLPAWIEVWRHEGGSPERVTHDGPGELLPSAPLAPGHQRVFRLPRRDVDGTIHAPLAYRITASVPVTALQFNPFDAADFSADSSRLLPTTLLGNDYVVMTREQSSSALRNFLTVVATAPGTTNVVITLTATTQGGQRLPGTPRAQPIPAFTAGESEVFTLEQFDVLSLQTGQLDAALTGTIARGDKPFALFAGSEAANAPNTGRCVDVDPTTRMGVCAYDGLTPCSGSLGCPEFGTCCGDHLEEQLPPTRLWGARFVAAKAWPRGDEPDLWRVLAAEDDTRVNLLPELEGVSIPVLARGEWFEFESTASFEIRSEHAGAENPTPRPILVGQFLAGQDAPGPNVRGRAGPDDAGTGDPSFILALPVEQFRRDHVIYAPAAFPDNYLSVVAPTGASVEIDGEEVPAELFTEVADGAYSLYRTRLELPGAYTIVASEPVSVTSYGFGPAVSYGHASALRLPAQAVIR